MECVVFISLDPVQISQKYQLDTMMLQLVDWAEGDFSYHSRSDANFVPVGTDGLRPSQSYGSTENWFKVRLFQGQRIEIVADMSQYSSNFDISQLKVENPSGIVSTGLEMQLKHINGLLRMRPLNLEFITLCLTSTTLAHRQISILGMDFQ